MGLLSTAAGMEYTIRSHPVELYLNGAYQGIYLLTDQVEKAKERVNIQEDGFLFEDDNRYADEVKRQWRNLSARLPEVREALDRHQETISGAVGENFTRWPVLGQYQISVMQVTFPTWEEEVAYARNYFEERVRFLDGRYGGQ